MGKWEEACQALGVAATATAAEIHTQYLYKAQLLHPDKTAALPEQARRKAEDELKVVNAAYAVLKDPKNHAVATPPKLKVSPRHVRFTDVEPGQQKSTLIRIENVGGAYSKFWMDDAPAPWLKVVEARSTTADPLPLEVTIEATGDRSLTGHSQCNLPIRIEHEASKTKDEVSIKVELVASKKERRIKAPEAKSPNDRRFALPNPYRAILLVLIPAAVGVIIRAFVATLIPLWILLAFSATYLTEEWFGYPVRKHKNVGIFYRLILNLGILAYLGFVVWSAVRLFSHQFVGTPLIGSLVFFGECVFFVWLWRIVGRNSWRFPSMKLTFFTLAAVVVVLSFAGVEPFSGYKNQVFSPNAASSNAPAR